MELKINKEMSALNQALSVLETSPYVTNTSKHLGLPPRDFLLQLAELIATDLDKFSSNKTLTEGLYFILVQMEGSSYADKRLENSSSLDIEAISQHLAEIIQPILYR